MRLSSKNKKFLRTCLARKKKEYSIFNPESFIIFMYGMKLYTSTLKQLNICFVCDGKYMCVKHYHHRNKFYEPKQEIIAELIK